jgi:fructose-1-phosphate kinase PfkB-like protein
MGLRLHEPSRGPSKAKLLLEPAAAISGDEMRALLEAFDLELSRCSGVFLCGAAPSRGAEFLFAEMARRAQRASVPSFLLCEGDALTEALDAGPSYVICGRRQLAQYCEEERLEEERFYERLFAGGCKAVLVTQGDAPVLVRTPEGNAEIDPPRAADRMGFGAREAFAAGFAHALESEWDLLPSVFFGVGAGTARIQNQLGGRLQRDTIEGFYRQVRHSGSHA